MALQSPCNLSGGVEVNPETKKKDKHCLSTCHCNLNGISAYTYSKLFLLNSYNLLHKFDIICLVKTYLDSKTPLDNDTWKSLVTRLFDLIAHLIPSAGVSVSTTKTVYLYNICNFVVLLRSPIQSQDGFETFSDNFEIILEILAQKNPFLMTNIGDFNAKPKNWYSQEKRNFEGNLTWVISAN